jgi:hypothetical protein
LAKAEAKDFPNAARNVLVAAKSRGRYKGKKMATEKEHQRNMRRISKSIKAIDAQIHKNEMQGTGVPQKSKSRLIRKKPPSAK